jgi:hypothetical protein
MFQAFYDFWAMVIGLFNRRLVAFVEGSKAMVCVQTARPFGQDALMSLS